MSVTQGRFIEVVAPRDATVVDTTWKYVNKKGGPDKRSADNPAMPVCLYDDLHFRSPSGLNELIQVSRCNVGEHLARAIGVLASHTCSTAPAPVVKSQPGQTLPEPGTLGPSPCPSRALSSSKQGLGAEIKVWESLPDDLRASYAHPLQQPFQEVLANAVTEDAHSFVPVSALATLMGFPQKAKMTPVQSRDLAETVGQLGYLLAPDTRLTGLPLQWDQEVALSPVATLVDAHMAGLVRLLYLSMAVAAADGFIEDAEIEHFNSLVAAEVSNENAWAVLRATEQLLRRDVNLAVRAIPQICRQVPAASRKAGSISKELREETEQSLKSGQPVTAICTSSLEMGIDIGSVESVGQVGPPWSCASLVQRLGGW